MIGAQQLIAMYELTYGVIKRRVSGVSHEESLIPAHEGANCLNWVLGHVMSSRSEAMALMGLPSVWDRQAYERYVSGSDPVDTEQEGLRFETIVQAYDESQELIIEMLRGLSVDDLEVPTPDTGSAGVQTIGGQLAFYHFHESYHLGQTDMILPTIRAAREAGALVG